MLFDKCFERKNVSRGLAHHYDGLTNRALPSSINQPHASRFKASQKTKQHLSLGIARQVRMETLSPQYLKPPPELGEQVNRAA